MEKIIGKGSYSKVFEKDDKTVIIYSIDPIKEKLSKATFDGNIDKEIIPYLYPSNDGGYTMKKLIPITKPREQLLSNDYKLLTELLELQRHKNWLERIDNMEKVSIQIINTIKLLVDIIGTENLHLDVANVNVMLDPNSERIVLTDIFMIKEKR